MTDTEAAKVLVKMGEKGDFSFSDAEMIAIDKAIAMLTKQTTEKPLWVIRSIDNKVIGTCPDCCTKVEPVTASDKGIQHFETKSYCPKCGKVLNWGEESSEFTDLKTLIYSVKASN